MNHKITDVNAYLFEQLDILSNPDLTEEELEIEIKKSKQITAVAKTIITSGRLLLDATKHADENYRIKNKKLPIALGINDETEN